MKSNNLTKIIFFLNLLLLIFLFACGAPQQQVLHTERDFQEAFNEVYFHGKAKMEVAVKYGRIDLLTDDYAIEVDRLEKFHEAMGQALHYAKETGRKPAIAIFIVDHKQGDKEKLKYVTALCNYYKIKVWFINEELEKAGK
jgi:spore coat polysaccharide biosynthesis predicted glycosyltransferase SpsG